MTASRSQGAPSFTARMALWSARHRWHVVIAWVVLVVLAVLASSVVGAETGGEGEAGAPGESGQAFDLLQDRFGEAEGQQATEIVVFEHPSLTVDDPAYEETVKGLLRELEDLRVETREVIGGTTVVSSSRIVSRTTSHYDVGVPREASPFVAQNETGGDVTFAFVELEGDFVDVEENIDLVIDAVKEFEPPEGFAQGATADAVLIGGNASVFKQSEDVVNEDFDFALLLNLPVTFVILVVVFGAVVAALVPLALAFAAVFIALGALALVSQAYSLPSFFSEVVLLLGLATGIDYSLFVITRFRRERRLGLSREDALVAASGTSGKAVLFAGGTVVVSLFGMFMVQDDIFNGVAISAIVVVLIAVAAAVTLLPSVVSLLGDNVDRWRVPLLRGAGGDGGGIWGAISDFVLSRPALLAIVTTLLLLAVASPLFFGPAGPMNLGFNGARALPDAVEAKAALQKLEDEFTLGLASPAIVVVDAGEKENVFAADVQSRVGQLVSLVEAEMASPENPDAPYGGPIRTDINGAGDTERIDVPINADTGEDKALDAVSHLRHDLIPAAFGDSPTQALVTGQTAFNIDFRDNIVSRTPLVFAFVLALAFLLLLVVFRSIVIPIKAIILNLLSVGAAYGVLVLVFQEGIGESLLNFEATGIVESWLPLLMFSILFGLSMDYHVFVLSRIKEAHEKGMANQDSVSVGIRATAATITSAAAIMVAVFAIFAFTRLIGLKQFGVGLAVAILIDATVIRSILLPASMKLLGDANWYLPSWLQWIPKMPMAEEAGEAARRASPASGSR